MPPQLASIHNKDRLRLISEISSFQSVVKQSQLNLIDRFVEQQFKNNTEKSLRYVELWRLIVAQEILSCEFSSESSFLNESTFSAERWLYRDGESRIDPGLVNPWFESLFSAMTSGIGSPKDFVELNKTTFWTFNYDRLLEQRFKVGLIAHFQVSEESAVDMVRGLNIWHIHGSVGQFGMIGGEGVIPYGSTIPDDIGKAANQVVPTFQASENADTNNRWEVLQYGGGFVPKVIFLGFGFDEGNLKRIGLKRMRHNHLLQPGRRVYWTNRGLSDEKNAKLASRFGVPNDHLRAYNSIGSLLDNVLF
jgi:SIR2-like domain